MKEKSDYGLVVADNETAARVALDKGNYISAFLLIHVLVESLLRAFLRNDNESHSFASLVSQYDQYLRQEDYPVPTFVDELKEFNRRRNRIVHQLWRKGYTLTNKWAKSPANAAVAMYGLFIEWLTTFDDELGEFGFRFDEK